MTIDKNAAFGSLVGSCVIKFFIYPELPLIFIPISGVLNYLVIRLIPNKKN